MHAAPLVSAQGTGGAPRRRARALLPALSIAVFTGWVLARAEWPAWPAGMAALAVGMVLGRVAWRRCAPVVVALSRDGQRWKADGAGGEKEMMIDLGPWLLLRLGRARPARWVALGADEAGPAWLALRLALYARPTLMRPPVVDPLAR